MKILAMIVLGVSLLFGVVDINSASKKELSGLSGIGPKKAEAIVRYRDKHCFKNLNELVNVKGIGKKTVEKNRKNIKVGKCKK
jgi:competence protein ComEA